MSHTIKSPSEIPDAPFYVMCNDKFMSGWGEAKGKLNTIILPCQDYTQAEIVEQNAQDRPEQQRVRIVTKKPRRGLFTVKALAQTSLSHTAPMTLT